MSSKIVRDPLYNYISIDLARDRLADLARRFLARDRFAALDAPRLEDELELQNAEWEVALLELVSSKAAYQPPEMYCLVDRVKAKYHQPYFAEKQDDEQSVKNSIRLRIDGEAQPVEISKLLGRLKPLTQEPIGRVRHYIPRELLAEAKELRKRIGGGE